MYQADLRQVLSQGDIIRGVLVAEVRNGDVCEDRTDMVVLSHECEILKPHNPTVLCARVHPIDTLTTANIGNVRAGRVLNAMHLVATGDFPESFLDFRAIHRILKLDLDEILAGGGRTASMTDEGRAALIGHIYRYFARSTKPPQP